MSRKKAVKAAYAEGYAAGREDGFTNGHKAAETAFGWSIVGDPPTALASNELIDVRKELKKVEKALTDVDWYVRTRASQLYARSQKEPGQ